VKGQALLVLSEDGRAFLGLALTFSWRAFIFVRCPTFDAVPLASVLTCSLFSADSRR